MTNNILECYDYLKLTGNSYTTQFRQYDPRLGRWLSVDPLAMKFPSSSPYVGMGNNPVVFVDVKGEEPSKNQAISLTDYIPKLRKLLSYPNLGDD